MIQQFFVSLHDRFELCTDELVDQNSYLRTQNERINLIKHKYELMNYETSDRDLHWPMNVSTIKVSRLQIHALTMRGNGRAK